MCGYLCAHYFPYQYDLHLQICPCKSHYLLTSVAIVFCNNLHGHRTSSIARGPGDFQQHSVTMYGDELMIVKRMMTRNVSSELGCSSIRAHWIDITNAAWRLSVLFIINKTDSQQQNRQQHKLCCVTARAAQDCFFMVSRSMVCEGLKK